MRVYVDFDHTISPNGLGPLTEPPYANCVAALKNLYKAKHEIVIYSCRANRSVVGDRFEKYVKEMKDYLAEHDIQYTSIFYGKPDYDVVIDDKALRFNDNWAQISRVLGVDVND